MNATVPTFLTVHSSSSTSRTEHVKEKTGGRSTCLYMTDPCRNESHSGNAVTKMAVASKAAQQWGGEREALHMYKPSHVQGETHACVRVCGASGPRFVYCGSEG